VDSLKNDDVKTILYNPIFINP
jgi:hypothetical protein